MKVRFQMPGPQIVTMQNGVKRKWKEPGKEANNASNDNFPESIIAFQYMYV